VRTGDAYGEMLLAALDEPEELLEIVEREDGTIMASKFGPASYLAPYPKWPSHQRRGLRFARGRVLDVGAGAGRVALHLQEKGHDAVAIDVSPGAVETCRRRGVRDARVMRIEDVDESLGTFDTVVMYGNNLALLASKTKGPRILRKLGRITSERARIIGECLDPYGTDNPAHLAYHERNRRRGRMGGQIKIRVRFQDVATPWFDYMFLSEPELREILDGTGWQLLRMLEGDRTYVAVIEKEPRGPASRTG
jgi:SAM-dependent methyltransferase